jgi:class 3 adenylate cyclase
MICFAGFHNSRLSVSIKDRTTLAESDTFFDEKRDYLDITLADIVRTQLGSSVTDTLPVDELEDLEVLAEIGRGGMGIVFRARQRSLQRDVAVKLLDPRNQWTRSQLKRFHKEVLLAASLSHPCIAHIHWVKQQENLFYFVMELIDGPSLQELLGRRRLRLAALVKIFGDVCDGLDHAHGQGVVHRDLKPANILVQLDGEPDADELSVARAVLVDFGLAARPGESSTTEEGLLMGTPAYMSPEQARGRPTDQRSDLYSLGITLFEAVTGRVPYLAPTPLAMALKHLSEDPPDPRELVPSLPRSLGKLILELLDKDPDRRPETCAAVKKRLNRCLWEEHSRITTPSLAPAVGTGLALLEVSILAVDLDGFMATAYDQAPARTAFLLEGWAQLVNDAVTAHDGMIVKQEAALIAAVFDFRETNDDPEESAIAALSHLVRALRAFNRTHGRHLTFTAGLETGEVFLGSTAPDRPPIAFGRAIDTAVLLSRVKNCGVGVVGPGMDEALEGKIPLEPLIGVADDIGRASRIDPEFLEQ